MILFFEWKKHRDGMFFLRKKEQEQIKVLNLFKK